MFLYGIDLEDANEISPLYHLTMLSGPIAILAVVSAECLIPARDAHFLDENQETGNQGPGNFHQEMGDQENQEKNQVFWPKTSLI